MSEFREEFLKNFTAFCFSNKDRKQQNEFGKNSKWILHEFQKKFAWIPHTFRINSAWNLKELRKNFERVSKEFCKIFSEEFRKNSGFRRFLIKNNFYTNSWSRLGLPNFFKIASNQTISDFKRLSKCSTNLCW